MSTSYHIAGWISVFFFLLSLGGVAEQLRLIWRRKRRFHSALAHDDETSDFDRPTAVLSLNQFFASFLAFYSFLVYGLCLSPLNHYLVWTRLPATLLVASILFEIWHDRRTRLSAGAPCSGNPRSKSVTASSACKGDAAKACASFWPTIPPPPIINFCPMRHSLVAICTTLEFCDGFH